MTSPILDKINEMKNEKHISFHTPGHKGRNTLIDWSDYIPFADLTEVGDLDNLHDPKGIIKESQRLSSKIFNARETIYSINGTTGGLYIGLGALTKPGDKVLIQRNSHKAIYNGCILNRLDIEYLRPNMEDGMLVEVNPEDIEKKLREDENIRLVVLTSPNYYGIVSDMERIGKIVRKYNRYLLVDEAHGSHLGFSDRLPNSSLDYKADIVVQSSHKTLPSFTQTSMIHIASDRVDPDRVREYSRLYQSTSPSYLFMLSLELAGQYMEKEGCLALDRNIDRIEYWIDRCKDVEGLHIYERANKDITKILFRIDGYSGSQLESLYEKSNIYLEMSDPIYALAICTVMNTIEEIDQLFLKMIELSTRKNKVESLDMEREYIEETVAYPIYEAFYMEGRYIKLEDSLNKVSKSFIIPYPPGVPLLAPGEVISEEILDEIYFLKDRNINIVGLLNDDEIEIVI